MRSNPATVIRLGVVVIVVAVVAAVATVLLQGDKQRHLTAYFDRTVGLYTGADVRILGIKVGKVTKITPVGQAVKVDMQYEADRKVPADAQALIVSQTLVADRFVQLTPVYRGGPVLADRTTLPLSRTQVPVEIDDIGGSLNELNKSLGPEGANKDGALSRLLQVGNDNLAGQGDDIRETIRDTSRALSTLDTDRGDVAETIENLRVITGAMRANDKQIRQFNQHLAGVSGQLAGEREELSAALRTLGPTLRNVQRFVKDNRTELAANVRQLAQVTGVLVKQKKSLAEFLETAPLGINNLARAYDPISGTIGNRVDLRQFHDLADWICSLAFSVGQPAKQCLSVLGPINPVGKALTGLSLDLSWITALTTHYDPEPIPPDAYGPNDPRNPAKGGPGAGGSPQAREAGRPPGSSGVQGGGQQGGQQGGLRDVSALLPGGAP